MPRLSRPHVIGVAGPSGAGKTTWSHALAARLGCPDAVVPLDAYYADRGGLPTAERAALNFDHPDAIDVDLLLSQLAALTRGEPVARPVYDFARHRRSDRTRTVHPARFVVLEGLLTLHWPACRALCATRVFVQASEELCLARRIARDTRERGRTDTSITRQWHATVRPMGRAFVEPTRRFAHAVVDGTRAVEETVDELIHRLGW